ncbi:hypothetical protein [Streptococcus gallolyticus]|uniref:hypothetical protein n=1 Tax=Streptococcus gallolyticus TaxID=315405 RepID=UPI002284F040|nr:hypothetical protein [Streptococcus gallolyticus]MCY7191475.1 tetratricopeptide repeat protein [Streptococcus gallolyticus subsp. gallolyticus]
MSNRKKTIIVSVIIVLLVLVASFFGYRAYRYHDFKRAYENGTVFEQIYTLTKTTRYKKAIEAAGYSVDNYDLQMNQRITSLVTNGSLKAKIDFPTDETDKTIEVSFSKIIDNQNSSVYLELGTELQLEYIAVRIVQENGTSGEKLELSTSEEKKLLKEVKEEITDMLKSVYESAY